MVILSEKIAIFAILMGILTAAFYSAIDIFFDTVVNKKYTMDFRKITNMVFFSGCTGGLVVSILFYALAITDATPIRTIFTYSIIVGVVAPALSKLLVFIYPKLFSKSKNS